MKINMDIEKCNMQFFLKIVHFQSYVSITVRDGSGTLNSSHRMGEGLIFPKNLCASLFNDDLSNEPNFGRIHLAGTIPLKYRNVQQRYVYRQHIFISEIQNK